MALASIFDEIIIDNPQFVEDYIKHIESSDGTSKLERLTDANISIATPEEARQLAARWAKEVEEEQRRKQ